MLGNSISENKLKEIKENVKISIMSFQQIDSNDFKKLSYETKVLIYRIEADLLRLRETLAHEMINLD